MKEFIRLANIEIEKGSDEYKIMKMCFVVGGVAGMFVAYVIIPLLFDVIKLLS